MTMTNPATRSVKTSCMECGWECEPGEYHPLAACLLYKQWRTDPLIELRMIAVDMQHVEGRRYVVRGES